MSKRTRAEIEELRGQLERLGGELWDVTNRMKCGVMGHRFGLHAVYGQDDTDFCFRCIDCGLVYMRTGKDLTKAEHALISATTAKPE